MPSTRPREKVSVREACDLMARVAAPDARRRILESLRAGDGHQASLDRLRRAMRSHVFPPGGTRELARVVQALDQRTKSEGFHVLESWDYVAHRFADDIIPVLMLDRCAALGRDEESVDATLSILLDQYFLSILGLLVVRAWDDPNPGAIFDDVTRLLGLLGDPSHRFIDDAATLLLLAVSHYHPRETAYDDLIARIATLDAGHRLQFALACAPVMSGHFRWGLRFMYGRDFGRLRDDNVVDYPWLLFAVRTLVEAYARSSESSADRAPILEGLLSGLSADPRAFTETVPRCLQARERDHTLVRTGLLDRRTELQADFEMVRPSTKSYSPLGFEVNFLCNAHVAMVNTAVMDHAPHPSLDALLATHRAAGLANHDLEGFARSLMRYASGGAEPNAKVTALIVYDPQDAQHAYNTTMHVLREA
jgi:hypothetical protein